MGMEIDWLAGRSEWEWRGEWPGCRWMNFLNS